MRRAATVCGPVVATVIAVLPLVAREEGFTEQVASVIFGGTVQLNVTVPVNPPVGLTVIEDIPDCPGAEMVRLAGLADRLKPGMTVTVIAAEAEAA